jgi:CHASE2 domain-containing sensor protein
MPPIIAALASQIAEARTVTRDYFFSHWNTLEWVFTARLLISGLVITVNGTRHIGFGLFLLLLGTFGLCVSSQLVRNFWLNIIFSVAVFLLSVGLAVWMVSEGHFWNILLYIHILDMGLSAWLCKRITEERFYYDPSPRRN